MATGTINKPSVLSNSSSNGLKFGYMYSDFSNVYIDNGKLLFSSYRNPILCCFCTQHGGIRLFTIWTGRTSGDWTLTVTNITGTETLTASLDGNNIVINGIGNWGQGYAIGL